MNLLVFDTCLDKTYVTLYDGKNFNNKVIVSDDKNYHSAYLISTIIEILKSSGMTPSDIDYFGTDIGPGSFTGIRACTTVARMLAQQLNKGLVGVSSLEILSKILGGNDLVALDARKNKAYFFDNKVVGAIELETVDNMVKGKRLVTDNSLLERFKSIGADAVSYQQGDYELGEILAKLASDKIKRGENTDWRSLKPLYIQPPPVSVSAKK